jgi:16S rRNA (adenine1518-N6/adenine1519-N6)-dimethyltransferase
MVVMLQKEVALSMLAPKAQTGLLAISVQVYATGRRLFDIPPGAFYPPPKVVSSLLRLERRPQPLVPPGEREAFFRVVRAGFSSPRKQVRNALANGLQVPAARVEAALRAAGIDPAARPSTITIEQWLRLTRELNARSA